MQIELKLIEIAAWQLNHLIPNYDPSWVATLPSLQRDAVWKSGQVELLWDSLFRGFPIGSLVISEKLKDQNQRYGKLAGDKDPWPEKEKRHLLDGQQRSNAIVLGFADPFALNAPKFESILWLDLLPHAEVFKAGTRHFLFRLTTRAHPWGYDLSDSAGRLHASEIQRALYECGWMPAPEDAYRRPEVINLWPAKANKPIPVAWLLLNSAKTSPELWDAIRERCEASRDHIWARNAATWLKEATPEALLEIENGFRRALDGTVMALEVPTETIRAKSKQENGGIDSNAANQSNVEHLFQRINNGGTPISPEDLQYSMVKAHWPGIEGTIDRVKPHPMRASRLALLGCRAAFASTRPKEFPPAISISSLRSLANDSGQQQIERRNRVKIYFGISDDSLQNREQRPPMCAIIAQIDEWLLHRGHFDIGLPPILRTAIAHKSPEVYLLLMVLTQHLLEEQVNVETFRPHVLALATALHWFSYDQHRAVQKIYQRLNGTQKVTPSFFRGLLHVSPGEDRCGARDLMSPVELAQIIVCPNDTHLEHWDWEQCIIEKPADGDSNKRAHLTNNVWPLICQILWNKELLIFAQREWLAARFKAFDNADTSAWEDHNRPWDYDHLLPQSTFHDVRNATYLRVCQRWGGTNGNFHILPFEENRSRGHKEANQTFTNPERWKLMLVNPDELDAFSLKRCGVVNDTQAVLRFVQATRRRLLAIYEDWYHALDIGNLLHKD